nr:hypothetical protein [Tanacetum cinerariifolium]
METGPSQDYVLIPLWNDGSLFNSSSKDSNGDNKDNDGPCKESEIGNQERPNAKNSTKDVNPVGPSINTASSNINTASSTVNIVRQSDDFFGADNDMRTRIEAIRLFLAYASFIRFLVYQMDVKSVFLYGKIKEEVYVCQPLGFEDPNYPDKVYKDKYVDEILRKFKYADVKPASTPMDKEKALLKDSDGDDVDVYFYRFQVNHKMSHLYAVNRIFRYLKGQPKLGLWYLRDSSFDLVVYTDSYYDGASRERKSTSGGSFLKKPQGSKDFYQIVNFPNASHIRTLDNGEIELNATVDGQDKTITKAPVRRHLKLVDADGEKINKKRTSEQNRTKTRSVEEPSDVKRNISYLTNFQEFDGGYVAVGRGAKSGKITDKRIIKTGKLDFKDVYFVKELKFNLFSVSQLFTWVFFLATKDETSRILKSFITEIENLVDKKVKIIRCDNGTEFKNRVKREYSVARTPQKNRAAKRRNKTLIEAARTMLADSKLPTTFLAEAVNTACYVKNRTIWESLMKNKMKGSLLATLQIVKLLDYTILELGSVDFFGVDNDMRSLNGVEVDTSNISTTYPVPTTPNTRIHKDHSLDNVIGDMQSGVQTRRMTITTDEQGFISAIYKEKTHEDLHTCLFACFLSQEEPKRITNALKDPAWGFTQEEGINYDEFFAPVARIEAIRLFLAYASFMGFLVYQMDVKSAFLYERIEEEVYVCQPLGFEDPDYPDKVYKVEKALYGLHQASRACKDKYVDEILRKFKYADVKPASTPMDKEKALLKDLDGDDVDVYLYRHIKGQPKLGLWYPRDSSFDLVAYTNSDYTGASLDRKSTSGGCQFLGCRLISWQCKKQTMVATSTTEAKYVAAANCYGQTNMCRKSTTNKVEFDTGQEDDKFWRTVSVKTLDNGEIELNATVEGQDKTITKASVRRHLKLADADGISTLPTTAIFEQLALMGKTKTKIKRIGIRIPQSNVLLSVADETITKEMHDGLGRATTTASSLEAEQGSGNISKTQTKATPSRLSSPRTSSKGGLRCHVTMGVVLFRLGLKGYLTCLMNHHSEKVTHLEVGRAVSDEAEIAQENLAQAGQWDDVQAHSQADEDLAQRMLEEERESLCIEERSRLLTEFINQRKKMLAAKRAEEKRNKPPTQAQQRTYMRNYIKIWEDVHLNNQSNTLLKKSRYSKAGKGSSKEGKSLKRPAEEELGQEQQKKQKVKEDLSQERLQQMMVIIPKKGIHIEALQTKEDLVKLWSLVKERSSSSNPTEDKEIALWVKLKRLFKPDEDDEVWKFESFELIWRLYDRCGVHHISTRDGHDIFMLIEKEYPLSRGALLMMLVQKLQVDKHNEMVEELLKKIFMQAERLRK